MAQTKGKKMTDEITEVKDSDFGSLELKIAKPTLNADKTVSISGNWAELGANIKKVVDRYKSTKLTEDNVEYVKTIKKQFVSLRTGVEREAKEWKTVYLDPAEDLLKAMKNELLAIIDEGESALGAQLDEYDQRRKDELTVILNEYVAEKVEKYGLRAEYATQIQLVKQYYNKTQKEEDTIDDIDRQAKELKEKQTAYDSGVALIKAECEECDLLPDTYIRELSYRNAMEIIMEIKQDKKKLSEIKAEVEEGKIVKIGEDLPEDLSAMINEASKKDKDEVRTRILRVSYKASQAKLIANFFKENGIKFEFINVDS